MSDDIGASQENDAMSEELLNAPLSVLHDDAPSEPAQDEPTQAADAEEKSDEDKESGDAKTAEATDQPKDDQAEQKPTEPSKEDREVAARRAYQERQRNRQQVTEQLDKEYGPKTEDQLIDEGKSPEEAKFEALRSELAYKEERTRVAELTSNMRADAVEVTNDFPVFNPKSKDYDSEFANMVQTQYQQAARLQASDDGSVIFNAEVPLYQFYQQMAQIYQRGTSRGTQQGQTDMQTMLARTENPGGSSSTRSPGSESLEELGEKLGDSPLFQ